MFLLKLYFALIFLQFISNWLKFQLLWFCLSRYIDFILIIKYIFYLYIFYIFYYIKYYYKFIFYNIRINVFSNYKNFIIDPNFNTFLFILLYIINLLFSMFYFFIFCSSFSDLSITYVNSWLSFFYSFSKLLSFS